MNVFLINFDKQSVISLLRFEFCEFISILNAPKITMNFD